MVGVGAGARPPFPAGEGGRTCIPNLWFSPDTSDKPHAVETNNGPAADPAVLWQNPDC